MLKRLLVALGFLIPVEPTPPAPAADAKPAKRRTNNGNGGRKSMTIARICPHCGTSIKGPVYFRHVATCKENPAVKNAVTAADMKNATAEPPLPGITASGA